MRLRGNAMLVMRSALLRLHSNELRIWAVPLELERPRSDVASRGLPRMSRKEEGPDNLCDTRKTIQPERTVIRSNL